MPITQDQMIEQMHESRAALTANQDLRNTIGGYTQSARERYYNNAELREVLTTILTLINQTPMPSQHVTYCNERYYGKRADINRKSARKQEQLRRMQGIPTREEYNKSKGLRDKESLKTRFSIDLEEYQKAEAAAARILGGETSQTFREIKPTRNPSKKTKFPRPDDKDLEFDGPPMGDENNSPQPTFGLDIPPDPYDNGQE